MRYIVAVFFGLLLCSCASKPAEEAFQTRLYIGTYDDVWLAALKALADYPLKISNKDAGKIQSEVINGPYNDLIMALPEPLELPERFRYSLDLSFAKLVSDANQPLVRIRIRKSLEKFLDFYTGWVPTNSDGLEEKVLLYRTEHLLRVDRKLQAAGP